MFHLFNNKNITNFIRSLIIALLCFAQNSFASDFELNVFSVGQANFTMLVNNNKALVFDCGCTGHEKTDWIDRGQITIAKQIVLTNLLNKVLD